MKTRPYLVALTITLIAGVALGQPGSPPPRSEAALAADTLFWSTFHGGHYEGIQRATEVLTAAYLQTPNDAVTAAHIGWMHIWKSAERARDPKAPATITDDIVLAHKYFERATVLDPSEARYLGFFAATLVTEGAIDHDDKLSQRAVSTMRDAVKAWPEFNLFTAGYVASGLPASSQPFKDGLEQQWQNMDVCAKQKIDRANPTYAQFMKMDTKEGKARACWNSAIAPHNLEGFFLNMGDMLVKTGDWKTAQMIYSDAKASKEYASWKFQDILDDRITNAKTNVTEFNRPKPTTAMMIDSKHACMACHQE
jgi:hypothetical protein